jgi:hypothetical protein
MFDLGFYRLVTQVLHEQQPTTAALDQKRFSDDGPITITVDDEDTLLRLYIRLAYVHYFECRHQCAVTI